jgi:hypothetical protein
VFFGLLTPCAPWSLTPAGVAFEGGCHERDRHERHRHALVSLGERLEQVVRGLTAKSHSEEKVNCPDWVTNPNQQSPQASPWSLVGGSVSVTPRRPAKTPGEPQRGGRDA